MKNNRYTIRVSDPLLRPGLSIETESSEKYLGAVVQTVMDKVREINSPAVHVAELPPLWIVGQERGERWEFAGVFNTEQEAIDACVDETFFIGPATLGERLPVETIPWHGAYWPKAQ